MSKVRKDAQDWKAQVLADVRRGKAAEAAALMCLCKELFNANIIGSDLDRIQVTEVSGRYFPQDPGGEGIQICFSVSRHMIGKTGLKAHEALDVLIPNP